MLAVLLVSPPGDGEPARRNAAGTVVDRGSALIPTPQVVPPPSPASPALPTPGPDPVVIAYRIEVRSDDPALADAPRLISAVLTDPRGWRQAGFDLVAAPDAPHVIVVAEGDEVDRLCFPYDTGGRFSCQNGPVVALNADRWRRATPSWPAGLDAYRTMLVNHEVGHLLGMHHIRCPQPGVPAPVMEQQSSRLDGCLPNPWPTPVEIRLAATHQFQLAPGPLDVPYPP